MSAERRGEQKWSEEKQYKCTAQHTNPSECGPDCWMQQTAHTHRSKSSFNCTSCAPSVVWPNDGRADVWAGYRLHNVRMYVQYIQSTCINIFFYFGIIRPYLFSYNICITCLLCTTYFYMDWDSSICASYITSKYNTWTYMMKQLYIVAVT